jgi:Probable molybdopterin binding domain
MTTANSPASKEVVTAALLVIGGKILSGRTKDQNIGYIAEYLTALGIDLKEVRVLGDEERAQAQDQRAHAFGNRARGCARGRHRRAA